MWQLGFVNNLFIAKGGILGPCEVTWDSDSACFIPNGDIDPDADSDLDELYSDSEIDDDTDTDDLDTFTEEDMLLCEEGDNNFACLTTRYRTYHM